MRFPSQIGYWTLLGPGLISSIGLIPITLPLDSAFGLDCVDIPTRFFERVGEYSFGILPWLCFGWWGNDFVTLADIAAMKAEDLLDTNQLAQSFKFCNKALKLDSKCSLAYSVRAAIYLKLGETEQALADFEKAISLNPKMASAYWGRSQISVCQGNLEQAIADISQAIEMDNEYYFQRGWIYFLKRSYDSALKDFEKYLRQDKDDIYAAIWRYLTLVKAGQNGEKQLSEFRKQYVKDETWISSVLKLYLGEITPAQCLEAAKHKSYFKNKENLCKAYFYLAEYHLMRGEKEQADNYFRKCIASEELDNFFEYHTSQYELKR